MPKRATSVDQLFLKGINPVIRFMILSDTVFTGAVGLLGPIFALFISDFIIGGNEAVAGIATAVYLFSKSILQIPIAHMIDRIRGEKDDFWILFVFTLLISVTPLLYLVINTPFELYIVQFILGIFTAFTFPTYMSLFTHHIDRGKAGTEWGIYFTLTDITSAILAAVGGFLAVSEGFPHLIMIVVFFSVCGTLFLLPIRPYLRLAPSRLTRRKKRGA